MTQVPANGPNAIRPVAYLWSSVVTGGEEDANAQIGPHVQSYMVATDQVRKGPNLLCSTGAFDHLLPSMPSDMLKY